MRPPHQTCAWTSQGASPGSGVAWVLEEMFRRIDTFMFHPEKVAEVVKWARPPFFSNSDEQTIMNDVVISSIIGRPYYVGAIAFFEVRRFLIHHRWSSRTRAWIIAYPMHTPPPCSPYVLAV